jgi:wyosine [tRNA(Phe)-imidazoG37] synthetase (radical SAM superfamily)
MLLELQKGIIYGPVHSRRLGLSLGLNLFPGTGKICSFNCVYCQYGWTTVHAARIPKAQFALPSPEEVLDALRVALCQLASKPAYLTFSGNGEPALHPDFERIVEAVIETRKELAPEAKTAILSNSTSVNSEKIRRALARLDARIMKLDCGSKEIFQKYNQPCCGVNFDSIIEGLRELSAEAPVTIQTLLSAGENGNFSAQNIDEWVECLKSIRPSFVQVYTLDRGFPAENLCPLSRDKLLWARDQVIKAGISTEVF